MTRLILMSDSHGKKEEFEKVCLAHPEADRFIFLGDGAWEFELLKGEHPEWPLVGVKGNCDEGSILPRDLDIVLKGHRIFCTHGNAYGVRGGTFLLTDEAHERKCDMAFYGHTHTAYCAKKEGVWVVNPGAVSDVFGVKYAIVDITDEDEILVELTELEEQNQ